MSLMNHSLRPWPIAVGLLVDAVGSVVFGLVFGTVMAIREGADIAVTTTDLGIALVFGSLLVAAGGYVAARRAGVRPVAHGVCVGVGVLVITLILEAVAPDPFSPQWFALTSVATVVPAGALGGLLASSRTRANEPLQPTKGADEIGSSKGQ